MIQSTNIPKWDKAATDIKSEQSLHQIQTLAFQMEAQKQMDEDHRPTPLINHILEQATTKTPIESDQTVTRSRTQGRPQPAQFTRQAYDATLRIFSSPNPSTIQRVPIPPHHYSLKQGSFF